MTITHAATEPRWLSPVFVRIGYGLPEAIRTPRDAMTYLHFRWPAKRGRAFDEARMQCASAVEANRACESAREAFIRASVEAGILD